MNTVNIFTRYEQRENDFTNGLFSLLALSESDGRQMVNLFLQEVMGLVLDSRIDTFRVLRGVAGTADAELIGKDCCLRFEIKIASRMLVKDQISRHLDSLRLSNKPIRRLVLLTPDDSHSQYIQEFLPCNTDLICHLELKRVYNFLEHFAHGAADVLSALVCQYLDLIHEVVFGPDFAGVIAKIRFGDESEVYADSYLENLSAGEWVQWNTPRKYMGLDGYRRKLLRYDGTRGGITVEVEVENGASADTGSETYSCINLFVPDSLRFFDPPIPLERVRGVVGLESFGRGQSAYQNIR